MTMDQERGEWLAWRKFGIGASDVAALCGMSPWASPMSVWADKAGLVNDEDNDYLEFGRRAEPMLTGYFEDRTGLVVRGVQDRCIHPEHSHHRCTLDGWVYESRNGGSPLGVVEYKTTNGRPWDEIPDQYAIQVQWQLHVAQADHAWMGVLHGRTFRVYELDRDDRAIDMLCGVVDRFWTDHVLTNQPPPADAHRATTEALAAAFPDPEPGASVALDDLTWALDLRADAKARAKAAKADQQKADNAIKAALGDAEFGTVEGDRVVSLKKTERDGYVVEPKSFRSLRDVEEKAS